MTRAIGAGLEAHFQLPVTTIAFCVNIVISKWQPRITNITNANPGEVTTRWAHGFSTGQPVKLVNVEGMIEVNEQFYTATVTSPTAFTIGVDTTAFTPFVKGSWYGTARKVLGFTNHVRDLVFGNVTYQSTFGAEGSSVSSKDDLALTTRDVKAMIDIATITADDLERGLYSGAEYETFEVNYLDLSMGRLLLEYGRIGDITINDQIFICEGLGLANILHQNIGPQISVTCRAQLGSRISDIYDERYGCKVRLNPPTWLPLTAYTTSILADAAKGSIVKPSIYTSCHFRCTTAGTSGAVEPTWVSVPGSTTADGTAVWTAVDALTKEGAITSVIDDRTFADANRVEPPSRFNFGLCTFLTGANAGWSSEVKEFNYITIPTFQQAANGVATASVANLSPSYPTTGNAVGDTFWLHVIVRNQTTTVATPAGWNLIAGPENIDTVGRSWVFNKASAGNETGTVSVVFGSDAAVSKIARIYRIRTGGVTVQAASVITGNSTTISGPTITSTTGNTLVLAFVSQTDDSIFAPFTGSTNATWTEHVEFSTGLGLDAAMQLQSAGIVEPVTISGGSSTIGPAAGWLVQAFVLPVPSQLILLDKPPHTMVAADTYEIEVGCDKIFQTCIDKFNNAHNFRGEPWLPGFHTQFLYPNSQ